MSARLLAGVAVSLLVCAACATPPPPAAGRPEALVGRTIAYRCPDGTGFRATMAPDGAAVRLEGLAPGPVSLPRVATASGARYSDGWTSYWPKGRESTLEVPGALGRVCVVSADPAALPGSRWRLVRIQSMDGTEAVPDDRSRYTLEFGAGDAVAGRADCNRLSGRWTATGESIALGPLAMTRAICPPGSLSDRYARSLQDAATWMIVHGRLAIAMKTDAGILHFEPMP
jgi:heat shock protein HslJ